jgi:hypothetical protein
MLTYKQSINSNQNVVYNHLLNTTMMCHSGSLFIYILEEQKALGSVEIINDILDL